MHGAVGAAAAGATRAHALWRADAAWPLPPRAAWPARARAARPLVQAARGRAIERVGLRAGVEGRARAVAARWRAVAAGGHGAAPCARRDGPPPLRPLVVVIELIELADLADLVLRDETPPRLAVARRRLREGALVLAWWSAG